MMGTFSKWGIGIFFILLFAFSEKAVAAKMEADSLVLYEADHPLIQYAGRIDFSNNKRPRYWSPGVYVTARFKGTYCELLINDQELWGNYHNYLEIIIDGQAQRIQTYAAANRLVIANKLEDREHSLIICKNTEAGIGYLEFVGLKCAGLVAVPVTPTRKIEFIGNSITCGTGSDQSRVACDKGQWFDQHNAWGSYGPTTARKLDAQWVLSAVSGIGLVRSCCDMSITMPQVFDKIDMRGDSLAWDFSKYQPDVITVCLGQNDGIQDSIKFCGAYVQFIRQLRQYYPLSRIILLTSPMADIALTNTLKRYLPGIIKAIVQQGDNNVSSYFYRKRYHRGCGDHPNLEEHQEMAAELSAFIKTTMQW